MSTAAAGRTRRIPIWDNARAACILLVVLGHAIQRLTYDSDIAQSLYFLIYAFHMPAFALISGYFSRSDPPSRRRMTRLLTDIVVPYVIFEGLWTLTKFLVEGQANPNLTQPSWTLWFLLALAIFRLVLPYHWTAIGRYTMYVYLLHSFVLYPFRESGVLRGLDPTWLWLPLVALLSVAITVLLASRPVRRVFRPLIEPRPGWLFADPDLTRSDGRRNDPTGSRRPGAPSGTPKA